jgi:WD40 repeat protein
MNPRLRLLLLLSLFLPEICCSQGHALRFVKQIGVGWQTDKFGWMSFVSFSPDGNMVASDGAAAHDDVSGSLTVWSFPEGKLIRQVPVHPTALSPDWKYYATFHGVGELATGKLLTSLGDNVYAVHAFSPDSRYVAESSPRHGKDGSSIRVLELDSGKQINAFGNRTAFSLAISPDGSTLAAGYWNIVVLWSFATGERVATLRGFNRYVIGLSFSKDGTLLAGGTDFGGLQIWDARRHVRVHSIQIEGGDVSEPKFSPDGRLIAVGVYGTGTAYLFDLASGKLLDQRKVSDLGCGSVAFSPDGTFLITPSTGGLIKWPYDRGGTIRVFRVTAQ